MKTIAKYKSEDRNAANFLGLSLRNAIEYLDELCSLRSKYSETEIQISKELTITHRALWTSLAVEVRKLFGKSFNNYKNHSLVETAFFLQEPYRSIVKKVHGDQITQRLLKMSTTFTSHISQGEMTFFSAEEICKSKLKDLFLSLRGSIDAYAKYARENDPEALPAD